MKRPRRGSTIKQVAYATRMLNGQAGSKKEAALLSGFSMSVAENAKYKIEDTEGYKNAMIHLAQKSNNLLMQVMYEFEVRGLTEFSNKDLISALNAISSAWDRIDTKRAPQKMKTPEGNPLRRVFTERVETRTRTAVIEPVPENKPASAPASTTSPAIVRDVTPEDPMDF